MEVVFIDSEPPGPFGGGIRTYIRHALDICAGAGAETRVYTHSPEAYAGTGAVVLAIGRKPWLASPWRPLLYRLAYHDNALWEHSRWLRDELEAKDAPGTVYEFCDFQGYAWHSLRSPRLRRRCTVRVHTPAWLTQPRPRGLRGRAAAALLAYRERDCLMGRVQVTLPSAVFASERLPWLKGGLHLPNPPPPGPAPSRRAPAEAHGPASGGGRTDTGGSGGPRFLYLGRIEARKGVLTLLAGFLRLAKEDPAPTLTLAGSDVQPYAGKVRALLEACPPELRARVAWEGPCPSGKRDDLLSRCDVLAVPSLWENSPYVYFEGMAAGLLCVGSATGEMKAAVEETDGLLGRPGDPEDWTRTLAEAAAVWRDPARRAASLAAQDAYLETRRREVPGRLLAFWRALAAADAEEGADAAPAGNP